MDLTGQTALVTGASSGIGAEFARRLAARGAAVVLVARRTDRLEALAAELPTHATVIGLDLSTRGAGPALVTALDGQTIDVLVNNAGFGLHGSFVTEDPARLEDMLDLNVTALVSITRALLPGMVERGRGAVVNVASTAAYQSTPSFAAYAASKAFVLSFTEALSHELRGTGVSALALSPGPTRTEFFDLVGEDAAVGRMQTAGQVVDVALRALDRRRTPPSVVSGALNRVTAAGVGLLPRRVALAVTGRVVG